MDITQTGYQNSKAIKAEQDTVATTIRNQLHTYLQTHIIGPMSASHKNTCGSHGRYRQSEDIVSEKESLGTSPVTTGMCRGGVERETCLRMLS